jgi:hypothetical protein
MNPAPFLAELLGACISCFAPAVLRCPRFVHGFDGTLRDAPGFLSLLWLRFAEVSRSPLLSRYRGGPKWLTTWASAVHSAQSTFGSSAFLGERSTVPLTPRTTHACRAGPPNVLDDGRLSFQLYTAVVNAANGPK